MQEVGVVILFVSAVMILLRSFFFNKQSVGVEVHVRGVHLLTCLKLKKRYVQIKGVKFNSKLFSLLISDLGVGCNIILQLFLDE